MWQTVLGKQISPANPEITTANTATRTAPLPPTPPRHFIQHADQREGSDTPHIKWILPSKYCKTATSVTTPVNKDLSIPLATEGTQHNKIEVTHLFVGTEWVHRTGRQNQITPTQTRRLEIKFWVF
jgi:hypothetical protein